MQPPIPVPPPPPREELLAEERDGVRLPVALEQALALKSAREVMVSANDVNEHENRKITSDIDVDTNIALLKKQLTDSYKEDDYGDEYENEDDENADDDEDDDYKEFMSGNDVINESSRLLSKTQSKKAEKGKRRRRRKKKKKNKQREQLEEKDDRSDKENNAPATDKIEKDKETNKEDLNVEVEYVQESLNINQLAPMYRQFVRIIDAFKLPEAEGKDTALDVSNEIKLAQELSGNKKPNATELKKVPKLPDEYDDDEVKQDEDEDGEKKEKLSKRKMKKLTRLSVAELKQLVARPDVVEMHDVTARDPKLLVQLKAHRNTVPVPRHWCFKRKYLQGKRGIEKQPFELPDFIKRTGIMEMRSSIQEKEDQKTLKAKMRERARPKLGKIDIDYQKLHDAFFKWQTKPKLSIHGDLYYEGKEYETKLREKKPGDLSDELRTALGMPVGPHAHKVPPPWLIAMQRYGPPPSYPSLKIPGLNAPIPESCSFGYHAGGWGKPPVDETGKPLYGDVFGTQLNAPKTPEVEIEVDKTLWGELESESEEESEEEDDEEEEEERDESGLVTPAEGLATPSGISSIPVGIHTPDIIELRKRKIESEIEGGETPALYQVLPEKKLDKIGGAMMASTHIYDVSAAAASVAPSIKKPDLPGTVELALDPSELDLVDTEAMAARYEQQIREQQSHLEKEDLSDMVADHVARQKGKRKKAQQQENKATKKYKEFKF